MSADDLVNADALLEVDDAGLVYIDGPSLLLAAAISTAASNLLGEAGGVLVTAGHGSDDPEGDGIVGAIRHLRYRMDQCRALSDAETGDVFVLTRDDRNELRRLAHLIASQPNYPANDPARLPERLLHALGPWFEDDPGAVRG